MELTVKEKKWVERVQKALNACPSKHIGFYTIGDSEVVLFDRSKVDEIDEHQRKCGGFYCSSVDAVGADFDEKLVFPNPVEATAG